MPAQGAFQVRPQPSDPARRHDRVRVICTIAGSDSCAGAGIQADIKAAGAFLGCHAATVITAITAQNTLGVQAAHQLPTSIVRAQIASVFDDLDVAAVKTGMLGDTEMIETVAAELAQRRPRWIVVDPVMISKTGFPLLADGDVDAFARLMLPLADLLTPNTHEAERLSGIPVRTLDDAKRAGERLLERGAKAVLVKGGHLAEAPGTDTLVTAEGFQLFEGPWIDSKHTHGTGCTYASAITARLAHEFNIDDDDPGGAIEGAKLWLEGAIRYGLPIGHGVGPANAFHADEWYGWGKR